MAERTYDLAVIGGGSAGLTASIMAARIGARVILIERDHLGGDCLHTGCVPSKALIASARMAHHARSAAAWGVDTGPVTIDFAAVMQRVRAVQASIASHDSEESLRGHGVEVVRGSARFTDDQHIEVGGGGTIKASRTIIATGARPRPPPIAGLTESAPLDSERVWSLERAPRRLVVIGAGPIGCELGQALCRLGSAVTLVERAPRILPETSEGAAAVVARAFAAEGIRMITGASIDRVERRADERVLHVRRLGGDAEALECDAVLVATGRAPRLDALGLEHAGVRWDERGVEVDDALRTSSPRIFAAGDCAGGPQSTHWAEREARTSVRNALYLGSARVDRRYAPRIVFTDPEVAEVGPGRAALEADGLIESELCWPMDRVDRALCEGRTEGFVQVLVDRGERIRHAVAVGELAGELASSWMVAIENGLTLSEVGAAVHPYPTFSRANRRIADESFLRRGAPWWASLAARFRGA